jgi:hypothetical protein
MRLERKEAEGVGDFAQKPLVKALQKRIGFLWFGTTVESGPAESYCTAIWTRG